MKNILNIKYLLTFFLGLLCSGIAFADPVYVTLSAVASTVDSTVSSLATVLVDISIISGVGFMMASFFKFHQHRQNPHQVQISQAVSLLIIGCGMILIPLLIPTIGASMLGKQGASPAKVGGSAVNNLVGKAPN